MREDDKKVEKGHRQRRHVQENYAQYKALDDNNQAHGGENN